MDLRLREARPDDAGALADLYLESARHHLGLDPDLYTVPERAEVEERIRTDLADAERAGRALFVAEVDGALVGWVEVSMVDPAPPGGMVRAAGRAHLGIVVSEPHRGRGVGRRLMSRAEEWAREHGVEVLTLDTHHRNEGALRFYERQGFRIVGLFLHKRLG